MDQKKRRNSILKKPSGTDEENTGDITTKLKRRISFSGKKSVKEFLAGEEQATIWGTSYEESAENLHANTTESTVVGVNEKRIVLRNRKVVVDANHTNKRRSKKQVHVAENDKENVFVPPPQGETKAISASTPTETVSQQEVVSSELALVKSEVQSVIVMKGQRDPLNAFSTTFDFINYSGTVNKSVTIEQSVDVSLDENELQMYKFRVPVSTQDVSPNLSVCRDGSSPNIFSGSILMSDEDMNMLKLLKVQMGGLISKGDSLKMIKSADKQTSNEDVPCRDEQPKQTPEKKTVLETADMEIEESKDLKEAGAMGKSQEIKSLKRKTITAASEMDRTSVGPETVVKSRASVMNTVAMDVHSPLRKKPMHKNMNKTMELSTLATDEQTGPQRRQTIHLEEDIDQSVRAEEKSSKKSVFRQTIHFDQSQIHEDTIRQEGESAPTTGQDDHLPMEVSFTGIENEKPLPQAVASKATNKRQSIHGPVDILEDSMDESKATPQQESIYSQLTIVEDSPTKQKLRQPSRESVYTPSDIVEDSPKPTKDLQISKSNDRQTIYSTDIVPEVCMSFAMPSLAKGSLKGVTVRSTARKTIVAAVDMDFEPEQSKISSDDQKTSHKHSDAVVAEIRCEREVLKKSDLEEKPRHAPFDMDLESTNVTCVGQATSSRNHESRYVPSLKMGTCSTSEGFSSTLKRNTAGRKSVCTPLDMVEDSPRTENLRAVGMQGNNRKSIYTPADMIEDSPKMKTSIETSEVRSEAVLRGRQNNRKSIYTHSNMIEDSPKVLKANETIRQDADGGVEAQEDNRKSIYTRSDMVKDSPRIKNATETRETSVNARKSICTQSDMIEESPKFESSRKSEAPRIRKSLLIPAEMEEDSPELVQPIEDNQNFKCSMPNRKSIYTAADIIEDSPKRVNANTVRENASLSGSIHDPADMIEDSPPKTSKLTDMVTHVDVQCPKSDRKSIYKPSDMVEDSFQLLEIEKLSSKPSCSSFGLHKSGGIFERHASGMVERKSRQENVSSTNEAMEYEHQTNVKSSYSSAASLPRATARQTIYDPVEILEDSPTKLPTDGKSYVTNFKKDATSNSVLTSSFKVSTNQAKFSQSPELKAAGRKTICAPTDMQEESPRARARQSIYTPADIIECSPKPPEPKTLASVASKIIVKHMTLQQGLMGESAAMRVLQKQQTRPKIEIPEPVQLSESALEMSIIESAPLRTSPSNLLKLNEQMIRGEVKMLRDQHKNKKSLFDRLEMIEVDMPQFESLQKKSTPAAGCLVQPRKCSVNDYTIDFASNTLDGQRRKGNEYTIDMSSRIQKQDDLTNLSLQISPISNADPEGKEQPTSPKKTKRQTIHFSEENQMDLSVGALAQEVSKSHPSRKTIHFHDHLEMDTSHTQPSSIKSAAAAFEKNPRTIHFHEDNQIEETNALPTVKVSQTIPFSDDYQMDLSGNMWTQDLAKSQSSRNTIHFHEHVDLDTSHTEGNSNQPVVEKVSRSMENNHFEETKSTRIERALQTAQDISSIQDDAAHIDAALHHASRPECLQSFMRQSCIMRASSLDTALQSIENGMTGPKRKTISAPTAMLEETRYNTNEQHDATMDLSTSICTQFEEPKSKIRPDSTSTGGKRRTIHCNDDVELESNADSRTEVSRMPQQKPSRADIDIKKPLASQAPSERQKVSGIPTRIAGRKTIHLNQDLEVDDDRTGQVIQNFRKCTARQSVYAPQSMDMDESLAVVSCATKADDNLRCKEDVSKALPKPRRTTFDELPIDVDEVSEKITLRKSSFSRTLNFDEVTRPTSKLQSLENTDSPFIRPKLKRCESTTEIDRSLAEYLKAEAAATLYGSNPDNMMVDIAEQSSHSEYYDAESEQVERDEFIIEQQDDHKCAPVLEESGMQPLQRTASRRDIEESVLDDRTRNQDKTEEEYADGSFEPRSVLANRLNHEFFDKEVSMSPRPEERVESGRQIPATIRRQTILQPEAMRDQSDIEVLSPEKPLESKEVKLEPNRKTIHFTNENAVDESFFDEKVSKPAQPAITQNNRYTVYFNESLNFNDAMDTSVADEKPETQPQSSPIGRSKAAQSMKEILRESNMLFSQSMLKPHFFESKHSTVYFNAKDISLETLPISEVMKHQDDNLECTPTKANKSRIPQLIGSAKKLQSMKKSMEFIQQNLPNLSCSAPATEEESASKQIHQATEELHVSCEPKQMHDSFETVEIPRKLVSKVHNELQESFETVDIPRRATTFQRNDTLYLCQNEVDLTNISQKSNYRFEDVPITISDVSTYFTQQPPPSDRPGNERTCSPNTTEALCNLDINKFTDESQRKSNDSEDTTYNFAKFKKRYVELTSESITSTGPEEDIEKTHLSLVNTLDEHESEVVRDTCTEQLQAVVLAPLETTKFSSSVCRKCKGDKRAVSHNDTTLGSFQLPPLLEYKMDLETLRELRNKPRLSGVANIWRQNLRESDSFNLSDGRSAFDSVDDDTIDHFKASLDKERRMAARQRQKKEFKQEPSFVHTLKRKLQCQKSNWILSDLPLMQNILKFTHTLVRTFAIFINFTPKDALGVDVEFNEIRVLPNDPYCRAWTPFDYVLHYQMLVELPFNLSAHYPKSENLFQLLEYVESVTQDVLKTGKDMMFHVLTSPATLIRESTGAIYIRKLARTKTAQNEVSRKEFHIEVMNMKKLSYESITMPPLYEFDEKIQLLPTGQDFLRVFLADPLRYLKT